MTKADYIYVAKKIEKLLNKKNDLPVEITVNLIVQSLADIFPETPAGKILRKNLNKGKFDPKKWK